MHTLVITNKITRRDEKSLEKYLSEISKYDVLTPEAECQLFKDYKNGDENALLKIVHHNLRFVVSVAKQYQHLGLWLGDLINEGNIGLLKAAQRFDETRGFKFISYAVWWIRQSILQSVNEKSRKIRLPFNFLEKTTKVKDKMVGILQAEEREASIHELSEATGFSEETVKKCLHNSQKCTSLDAPLAEDGDQMLLDKMTDFNMTDPDYKLAVCESQKKEVRELLSLLPEKEAFIISMYYGIGNSHAMGLSDIADFVGVSRERVRQIRDKGLMKLRTKAKGFIPTFFPN